MTKILRNHTFLRKGDLNCFEYVVKYAYKIGEVLKWNLKKTNCM